MEPVWLGLAATSILSSAGNLAHAATRPFAATLERAAGLLEIPRDGTSASDAEGIQIAEVQERAEKLTANLHRRIRDLLASDGVPLDQPLQLRISTFDGELEVAGDSAQRSMVEAALASDPSIAEDFQQLTALHTLLAAADGSDQTEFLATLTETELQLE